MIKTSHQLTVARKRAQQFEEKIVETEGRDRPDNVLPRVWQAFIDGMKATLDGIRNEIRDYELLEANDRSRINLTSLDHLPTAIIQMRIAEGLNQTQFAERLGVKPQQVQRWEADENQGVSFDMLKKMSAVLRIEMTQKTSEITRQSTVSAIGEFVRQHLGRRHLYPVQMAKHPTFGIENLITASEGTGLLIERPVFDSQGTTGSRDATTGGTWTIQ